MEQIIEALLLFCYTLVFIFLLKLNVSAIGVFGVCTLNFSSRTA
jgi:hypothetical protein